MMILLKVMKKSHQERKRKKELLTMMFIQERELVTSKAPQFKRCGSCKKMSCSASWTRVPMCSAVIARSGGQEWLLYLFSAIYLQDGQGI